MRKIPVFAGRLVFLLDFQHKRKIFVRTSCDFFIQDLPSVLDFKLISVHFVKNQKTPKRSSRLLKCIFAKPADDFCPQFGIGFSGSAKMKIRKTHRKIFSSQSNLLYPKQAVSTTVSKIMAKNTIFFWWILEQTFRKSFVRWTKTFLKSSNVHFDCSLDTPAKKIFAQGSESVKK